MAEKRRRNVDSNWNQAVLNVNVTVVTHNWKCFFFSRNETDKANENEMKGNDEGEAFKINKQSVSASRGDCQYFRFLFHSCTVWMSLCVWACGWLFVLFLLFLAVNVLMVVVGDVDVVVFELASHINPPHAVSWLWIFFLITLKWNKKRFTEGMERKSETIKSLITRICENKMFSAIFLLLNCPTNWI